MGFLFRFFVVIPLVVIFVAILCSVIEQIDYISATKPEYLGAIQDRSPNDTHEFGRYTKPLAVIDYSWVSQLKLFNFLSFKHWSYLSVSTKDYFIVAAIADFNYAATAFVYVVDRKATERTTYQYSTKSYFSKAMQERAKSSVDGCSHYYQSATEFVRHCYNGKENRYEMEANVPTDQNVNVAFKIHIKYSMDKDPSLVLLYPVEDDRPVYTHKRAALSAAGTLSIAERNEEKIQNGLASIDWTLGYPEKQSRWKWVSLSTVGTDSSTTKQVPIGINLSDQIYDDNKGVSMEAAVWIDGKVYTVGAMSYQLPEKQHLTVHQWHIHSKGDIDADVPYIELTFQPWGSQEEHINLIIFVADFVQAFGIFNGTIHLHGRKYLIEDAVGVTESHYAKW